MRSMTWNRSWREQVKQSMRGFPTDLAIAIAVIVLVNVLFYVPGLQEATLLGAQVLVLIGLPALLFLPGYVLVAIVFPADVRDRTASRDHHWSTRRRSIDPLERAALSFGMSVALLPLFGLVLDTWWELTTTTVLSGFTVMIAIGITLAAFQRLRVPPAERYQFSIQGWLVDVRRGVRNSDSTFDTLASAVLALAILVAIGTVGYAVATPYQSGQSSTLYLTAENETGTQAAAEYPSTFTAGEPRALTVGIENEEEQRQPYTVIVVLERVRVDGTEATVLESQELNRLRADVPAGETWTERHTVAPTMLGEDLRLHYYLYEGETAPAEPGPESSYRDAYLWIDVTEA